MCRSKLNRTMTDGFFFPNGLSHCPYHVWTEHDRTSWWSFRASQRICISETLSDAESAHAQAMWEVIERPRFPKGTYKIWTWSHASLRRPKRFYSLTTANDFADSEKIPRPPTKLLQLQRRLCLLQRLVAPFLSIKRLRLLQWSPLKVPLLMTRWKRLMTLTVGLIR